MLSDTDDLVKEVGRLSALDTDSDRNREQELATVGVRLDLVSLKKSVSVKGRVSKSADGPVAQGQGPTWSPQRCWARRPACIVAVHRRSVRSAGVFRSVDSP